MEILGITDRMTIRDRRVEVRGGGGCLPIIGVLLWLLGCAPIIAWVFGAFTLNETSEYVIAAIMSLFTIAFGVLAVFARFRFEIDGNSRTYRKRFSVLVVIKETAGSLDEFDKVVVSRRVRRHDRKTYTDYPVQLEGPAKTLDLATPDGVENARRDAEQVAKALRLPLADRTGPDDIVREADRLDESLRQRRHRTGEGPGELPPPPEGMKTQFRIDGKEVVLEIPPAGFTSEALGYLISWAILAPGLAIVLFRPFRELAGGADSVEPILVLLLVFLSICAGVGILLRSLRRSYTVRVSPERLHLTTRGVLFSKVSEIPADELEELHITKPENSDKTAEKTQIEARSDRTTVRFGLHLSPEEKEWVKTVLEHMLTE